MSRETYPPPHGYNNIGIQSRYVLCNKSTHILSMSKDMEVLLLSNRGTEKEIVTMGLG